MPPREDVAIVGPWDDPGAHELREFLSRIDQPYSWVNPGDAGASVPGTAATGGPFPQVTIGQGLRLDGPALEEVADALGIRYPPKRSTYDLIVIGAGPAGLAAAVYAASDGLRTAVAERAAPGGQAAYTAQIENYFGLDPLAEPMTGARLARIGGRQAEMFGAELLILRGVVGGGATPNGDHRVVLSSGESLEAPALLCATGVAWRRLEVAGVDELLGRGVFYGAGRSEAPHYRDRDIVIVGGGNSAGQAALNFAAYARSVTMVCRGASLGGSLSRYLADRIGLEPRITVRLEARVAALHADGRLESITVEHASGKQERIAAEGLFIAIGGEPQTDWADDSRILRDQSGFLLTGSELLDRGTPPADWPLERLPAALESSLPGFFIAGDVRHGSTKRVAAAVGEGANAVALVHRHLEGRRRSSG